jgi:UDP-N-acetylmuramoyl-tripeptide--D-alanyl-D-alanine ligase
MKKKVMSRAIALRKAHPALRVIGITGSVGKTTTKELLKHVLKDLGAIATPMHVNTEMGVAAWLTETLKKEPADSDRILIVEMGAYRGGEIALLCDIAKPSVGVLTYVGRQHVALFGGEQGIARAKAELLASLPVDGRAYVNADSPLIDVLLGFARCPVLTAGTDHHAMLKAFDIEETGKGVRFQADGAMYEIPLAGTHMVTNVLLTIATAKSFGMSTTDIAKKLASFTAFERTFARRQENGITVLDNTYNASPEGFIAAIDWASHQPEKEKVLLLDGVIELGDDEERIHREIASRAAKVFGSAYVVNPRFLPYFKEAFGSRVKEAVLSAAPLTPGTLLVCMGRMPQSLIRKFIP